MTILVHTTGLSYMLNSKGNTLILLKGYWIREKYGHRTDYVKLKHISNGWSVK